MFNWSSPPVTPPPPSPTKEMRYIQFRAEVFRDGVRAGAISPMLPADTLDRWLDRAWLVVNKPLDEEALKERKIR